MPDKPAPPQKKINKHEPPVPEPMQLSATAPNNQNNYNHIFGLIYGVLICGFFLLTPWDRMWAEYLWMVIAIISMGQLVLHKVKKEVMPLPKEFKKLIYIFILIPTVSIISFVFSPLDNLSTELLEPDSRWLLFIPIVIAVYRSQINPNWVLAALVIYCVSAFSKGFIDTNYATELWRRAWGDENPNPFGMFNSMITLMLMAFLLSPGKKTFDQSKFKYPLIILISISIALGILSTYFTGTRTALFLIGAGVLLHLLLNLKSKNTWFIFGTIIVCTAAFLASPTGQPLQKRIISIPVNAITFFNVGDRKSKLVSTGQRLEQWRGSICVFKKHPLHGTGPRSARNAFALYGGEEACNLTLSVKPGPRQTHSLFFNTLLTLGIVGILIFGVFFFQIFNIAKHTYKQTSPWQKVGGLILFMYLLGMAINGIGLDMWFRNYMVNKNLMALLLPLIIIAWQTPTKIPDKAS